MKIYFERQSEITDSKSFALTCAREYFKDKNIDIDGLEILVGERGKPLLSQEGAFVSIAHSGGIVAVAVAEENVGIDLQYKNEKTQWEKLSKKYFPNRKVLSANEFFIDFVKAEAYAKFANCPLRDAFGENVDGFFEETEFFVWGFYPKQKVFEVEKKFLLTIDKC